MTDDTLITQAEFARLKGWSRANVSKLVKSKRITLVDGKINPALAEAELAAHTNPANRADQNRPAGVKIDYMQERARREHYAANTAELDFEEKAGRLVDKSLVEAEAFETAKATREALMMLPARLAGQLAALDDAREVQALLDAEIRAALENLTLAVPDDDYPRAAAG